MGILNFACWGLGILLIVAGYGQARGPYGRYQQLKEQEANIARYEGWRGNRLRDEGPSAAALMAEQLRARVRLWAGVAVVGVVLLFVGFAVR